VDRIGSSTVGGDSSVSAGERGVRAGGGVGAEQPAACGGAGGADGDGAGKRSKWRLTSRGSVRSRHLCE
jgi:hypothetical protein